jgi:hypothetical protein
MPKSLPGDLRERVIEAVEAGASRREAAEPFEISPSAQRILCLVDERSDRTLDRSGDAQAADSG